jgi:pyruvate dehydrogenase E2 component (dihydrolipoamide acetyltransferase)
MATGFTPIVNAPEVAILGVSKATIQPSKTSSLLMPPLAVLRPLVINGAAATLALSACDVTTAIRSVKFNSLSSHVASRPRPIGGFCA